MRIYEKNDNYELIEGDMLKVLDEMPENSVDAIVTDPPYEIDFMNKGWDSTGIAFKPETWAKCLRVLKPGGNLVAFGGSRTYHRIACAIEDGGFKIRDTLMYLYGAGFPKSMNIGKAIDKSQSQNLERELAFTRWMRSTGITSQQIKEATGTEMASHYLTDKSQPAIATADLFDKIRPFLPEVPEYIEKLVAERTGIQWSDYKKREKIGECDKVSGYAPESGIPIKKIRVDITKPYNDLAKDFDGYGTCLKPAYEPIIWAMKPLDGSYVVNARKWGTAGINIDESRVGKERLHQYGFRVPSKGIYGDIVVSEKDYFGRFPSDVIIDDQSAQIIDKEACLYGEGSVSRFFYSAKASNKDRDEGLELDFQNKQATDGRRNFGVDTFIRFNTHPTVKPCELMQYLIRLFAVRGGVILDPFNGSGSTGKAAMFENRERGAGYRYIGIDITSEYLPISKARIDYALYQYDYDLRKKEAESGQQHLDLFEEEQKK